MKTRNRLVLWGIVGGLLTALGLLNASSVVADRLTSGGAFAWRVPLVTEMTGAYSILLLMPPLLWFMRQYPVGRRNWPLRVPLHLAVSVVFGACSTLIMWGSRTLLWKAIGWGSYDYGDMRYRFPMEYSKQLMAYIVIYGCVTGYAYIRRTREREMRAKDLEKQLVEARLAALKMQLNPHFLFNALNMISNFVYEDPDTADSMLAHLSDFLRLTLSRSEAQEVPLEAELGFLRAYLAIMSARFGDGLDVKVGVEPGTESVLVPHLILQPLVENAIEHASGDSRRPARIGVSVTRAGEHLLIAVRDNGPGLRGEAETALSAGVGLSNTAGRLAALYGDDYGLRLENAPEGGLSVAIELPVRRCEQGGEDA